MARSKCIVFSSEEKAKQAYEEWRVLEENVWFYPARDLLFYHADIKGAFLTLSGAGLRRPDAHQHFRRRRQLSARAREDPGRF